MTIVFVLTGLFLILLGFLVKIYPNLLAGYNTMSEAERQQIDIERLSTVARNGLILTGATTVDASVVMHILKIPENTYALVITAIILVGISILVVLFQRISKRKP